MFTVNGSCAVELLYTRVQYNVMAQVEELKVRNLVSSYRNL
jgi:hypothetical protein